MSQSGVVEHLAELTGSRDRDVLDVTLVTALKDVISPRMLAVYRCVGEPDQLRWWTRAHWLPGNAAATADSLWADLDTLPLLASEPLRMACLQSGQPVAAAPVGELPACTYLPLEVENDGRAVLEVHTDGPLNQESLRLLTAVLRVYGNFQGLLNYSQRDTLTGLLNRKTLDDAFIRLAQQVAGVETASGPSADRRTLVSSTGWMGVIDIDHFKRVNDGHGHLIGDEVLLLLARLLRSSFRHYDQLFRFGGEEFVVLIRCGSAADALGAFERLRCNVERYAFPKVGGVTVSVGLAELRRGDSSMACFERADKALYAAKQGGRNRVNDFDQLLLSGQVTESESDSDVELF